MMDWQAKQPTQVACIAEDLKCSAYGHKAKDITPSTACRRGMKGQETATVKRQPLSRDGHCQETAAVNQMNSGTVSKTTLGKKTSERQGGAHMGFSKHINTIFN